MADIKEPWRPKDGPGPRGVPDCYYRSRVLNSTHHYATFVSRLRRLERTQALGDAHALRQRKDFQFSEFCVRSDRRNCINAVARKVDLCMESYQDDLNEKRARLRSLLTSEEEHNTRKLVAQAQAGVELGAREREGRLLELRAKRRQEHLDKYKDTPLSKCAHITALLVAERTRESKACQLYQIREKQSQRLQQAELDHMWHEVSMKESEALAARSEYDAMERYRRDIECKEYGTYQVEQRKWREEQERERLKEETIRLRQQLQEQGEGAAEEERALEAKRQSIGRERIQAIKDRAEERSREKEAAELVQATFDSLKDQSSELVRQQIELRKRKEREVVQCNRQLLQLKDELQKRVLETDLVAEVVDRQKREEQDERRCVYERKRQTMNKEAREGAAQQVAEHLKARLENRRGQDERAYGELTHGHLVRMDALQAEADAAKRKKHQQHLREQIAYQGRLRESAAREEAEVLEKYKAAEKEYREQVAEMLRRPFFSDELHPFTRQMAKGLTLPRECPCADDSKNYCAKSH